MIPPEAFVVNWNTSELKDGSLLELAYEIVWTPSENQKSVGVKEASDPLESGSGVANVTYPEIKSVEV
jgi:hypothetical protein